MQNHEETRNLPQHENFHVYSNKMLRLSMQVLHEINVYLQIPLGISVAAGVRVGNHLGANKPEMALTASRVSITIACKLLYREGIHLGANKPEMALTASRVSITIACKLLYRQGNHLGQTNRKWP